MIAQFTCALFTLAIVVLVILVMTRAISLVDALKAMGKGFLLVLAVSIAVCLITPPSHAAMTATTVFLKLTVRFLAVAVPLIAAVTLVLWVLMSRLRARSNTNGAQDLGRKPVHLRKSPLCSLPILAIKLHASRSAVEELILLCKARRLAAVMFRLYGLLSLVIDSTSFDAAASIIGWST